MDHGARGGRLSTVPICHCRHSATNPGQTELARQVSGVSFRFQSCTRVLDCTRRIVGRGAGRGRGAEDHFALDSAERHADLEHFEILAVSRVVLYSVSFWWRFWCRRRRRRCWLLLLCLTCRRRLRWCWCCCWCCRLLRRCGCYRRCRRRRGRCRRWCRRWSRRNAADARQLCLKDRERRLRAQQRQCLGRHAQMAAPPEPAPAQGGQWLWPLMAPSGGPMRLPWAAAPRLRVEGVGGAPRCDASWRRPGAACGRIASQSG